MQAEEKQLAWDILSEIGSILLAQTTKANPELNIALRCLTQVNQIQKLYYNRMKHMKQRWVLL